MNKLTISFICFFSALAISAYSQPGTQTDALKEMSAREADNYLIKKSNAIAWAKEHGYPVKAEISGSFIEIQYIDKNGNPQYFKTDNAVSSATISTNKVQPGGETGLNLTGSGIVLREWDGGTVLSTHQEFSSRVTNVDAVATHYHSTHVAGTMIASGVVSTAKGMAVQATVRSFDWNSDVSEMASEAAAGALISNHSYGYIRGWYSGTWYGDPSISTLEDYLFGFYSSDAQAYDQVAVNAPYFLICKSAGNDRGDSGDGSYPADGPYDCIGEVGIAKNILTVGAVDDIPGGYASSSGVTQTNTYFSSWGPADDGRIKPDIVTNGYALYSTYNTNNTSYASLSGTSMATPSAAGSLALLQQHYNNLKGSYMRAATLKALVIQTADEAGPNTGPDYMFGWGLMNTKTAALKISEDQTNDVISELTLSNGGAYTRNVVATGSQPLKVTIVWTDPAGTPPSASLDPITPMLVNDLDLRLTNSGSTFYSWKLDRNNPSNAATNSSENNVDNVEVVYISSPTVGATYTITVDHDGTLSGGSQAFSIIISGIQAGNSPIASTIAATSITPTSATLNGTINPNGIATNYYFEWGSSASYGYTTTVTSAGSGTSNVSVSASISSLTTGITYHFRVVAINSEGTTYGNDLTFTPGAAAVTTTSVSNITSTTATTGGIVTIDGGSAVTVRGVCWATTTNPVATGNHTTDGSGTGTFTSSITGLSSNTTYYVRAYATNVNGTYYGDQIQFITACGIYSLTFSENFATSVLPICWSKQMTAGATDLWTVSNTANAGGTAYEMLSTWQNVNPATTRLVTPALNTVGVTQLNLSFKHMLDAYSTGCTLRVQSSSNGTTWTNEAWSVATTATNINATTVNTTVLNNLNTTTTYIAFTIEGNLYNYDYWYIDAVSVSNACGTTYPVSVSISRSADNICVGTSVTFTATPTNGGTTPSYQWKVNGTNVGTNSATYAYAPVNNDAVTCVLTSNATCTTGNPATSNTLTMTVNPLLPVSLVISRSSNPVCAGTSVNFTAIPTNGGTTPSYQWKVNGTNVGTNSASYSYAPANNDAVTCVLTSNATCPTGNPATSNTLTMAVNPLLPVSIVISRSSNPVCAGTGVNFTAIPTNGGTTPSYQWKVNGTNVGTNSASFSYAPVNNDAVTCVLTSNATCPTGNPATSNTLTMNVNPLLPVTVSIAPSANPACAGTSVIFTATPANGGTTPSYQWKVNGTNVGTNSASYSYAPANSDAVTCVLTSNATCTTGNPATSNLLTMTIHSTLAADFMADNLTPPKNETVHFTDLTTGGATTWNWSFDRPGVVFVNGTNASSQNPQVQFTDGGLFQVTLLSSNPPCTDSEIKSGYLRAGTPGIWTGNTSTDWYTLSNWDNYVIPDGNTDMVVPASATFWPVFNGDLILGTHCKNLILIDPTSKITITGNLVVQ